MTFVRPVTTACTCILFLFLGACATPATHRANVDEDLVETERHIQREIALRQLLKREARLLDVANDLLIEGAGICDETRPYAGAKYASIEDFEVEMQDAARSALNVKDGLTVLHVVAGSPADQAGLKAGDVINAVDGKVIKSDNGAWGESITQRFQSIAVSTLTDNGAIDLTVSRNGAAREIKIESKEVCAYNVILANSDTINAYADGQNIVITTGMMRFAEDDDELALVVAHELAHNAMGHLEKRRINAIPGLFLDILAAASGVNTQGAFTKMSAQVYSEEFEAEADYVGLYFMALANRPLEDAPYFWRRMAAEKPQSTKDHMSDTHPTSPERFVAIQNTIEEIQKKLANGEPLEPELAEPRGGRENAESDAENFVDKEFLEDGVPER